MFDFFFVPLRPFHSGAFACIRKRQARRRIITKAKDMNTQTRKQIMNCSNFNELLTVEYGQHGTRSREQFEAKAEAFVLGELSKN